MLTADELERHFSEQEWGRMAAIESIPPRAIRGLELGPFRITETIFFSRDGKRRESIQVRVRLEYPGSKFVTLGHIVRRGVDVSWGWSEPDERMAFEEAVQCILGVGTQSYENFLESVRRVQEGSSGGSRTVWERLGEL